MLAQIGKIKKIAGFINLRGFIIVHQTKLVKRKAQIRFELFTG